LGLTTVAEGIESDEHLRELRRLGCDLAQGYWFAKPMAGADMERYLAGESDEVAIELATSAEVTVLP
ncbi:MAG: EAL domain-containing protein, partial [Actinomycetota bacterium]